MPTCARCAAMSEFRGNSHIVSFEDHKVIERTDRIGWDILIRMELLTSLSDHVTDKLLTTEEVIKLGIHICRAMQRRMRGEAIPPIVGVVPALNTLILKACAFDRNERFGSAAEMREALETLPRASVGAHSVRPQQPTVRDQKLVENPVRECTEATEGVFDRRDRYDESITQMGETLNNGEREKDGGTAM